MSLINDLALATVFTGIIYLLTYIICHILLWVYPQLRIGNYVYVFMLGLITSISIMLIMYHKFWQYTGNDLAFIGMANIVLFIGFVSSLLMGWQFSGVYGTLAVLVGLGILSSTGFIRFSNTQTQKVVKEDKHKEEEVDGNG